MFVIIQGTYDGVGINLHNIPSSGVIMKSIGAEFLRPDNNNNNNNCLKSNIQCIEIRVQWTVHLGSSHMHVHAVTPKLVICVMYLTSI